MGIQCVVIFIGEACCGSWDEAGVRVGGTRCITFYLLCGRHEVMVWA